MTTILCGDCRLLMPLLGKFNFIFADPPFNIGQEYQGYVDKRYDFEQFTFEWIAAAWEACDGVLCLHGPDSLADIYVEAKRRFSMRRVAWVNWHYRFGQCSSHNWIDSRCHCMIFSKYDSYTWNPDDVRVDSDRKAKYNDSRIGEYEKGGRRLPFTIWGVESDGPNWGRVQGNNPERVSDCPNQLPEVYLERLIRAYTNPGDTVLDPFGGSGTTITVGTVLGRECTTIDVSEKTCETIRERLKRGAIRVKAS